MSSSYSRSCRNCGRPISMRQMPAGQWVAFENDAGRNCSVPPKKSRKPKPNQVNDQPAPVLGHGFDEFDLPSGELAAAKNPEIAGDALVRRPVPKPARTPRLRPQISPLPQISRAAPKSGQPDFPENAVAIDIEQVMKQPGQPIAPPPSQVPTSTGHDFGQWLVKALAAFLIFGLVKVLLWNASHSQSAGNLSRGASPTNSLSDATRRYPSVPAPPNLPTGPTTSSPPAPPPSNVTRGTEPVPSWLRSVTIPSFAPP
jgi:hypothetical protein